MYSASWCTQLCWCCAEEPPDWEFPPCELLPCWEELPCDVLLPWLEDWPDPELGLPPEELLVLEPEPEDDEPPEVVGTLAVVSSFLASSWTWPACCSTDCFTSSVAAGLFLMFSSTLETTWEPLSPVSVESPFLTASVTWVAMLVRSSAVTPAASTFSSVAAVEEESETFSSLAVRVFVSPTL